ncbi:MAG: glycerol dehydrogenase [Parahaliea sp.]
MTKAATYFPFDVLGCPNNGSLPRAFVSPHRYIQGPGVLDGLGRYLSVLSCSRAGIMLSPRGRQAEGQRLEKILREANIEPEWSEFQGESSLEEITAHADRLAVCNVGCLVAFGGGKCVDAGKAVAYRLGVPVVIIPTLASNDAPCSALSVIYTPEGVSVDVEFFPEHPVLVLVDTEIIAAAPERYLVAGMGDAMATWYEAVACWSNPSGINGVGTRPTLAAQAIAEACAKTLFQDGTAAAAAVVANRVDAALENVVEANTLLSGLGFESGGLAAAHGVAQSFTLLPQVHDDYLHGEMVAFGTLAQLMVQEQRVEALKVAEFFAAIGLPVHLGQLGLSSGDQTVLDTLVEGTLAFPFIGNLLQPLDADAVRAAILAAHQLGETVSADIGDAAYRRVRNI